MDKTCPKCGEADPSEFSKSARRPDGVQVYCKECMKGYKASWAARNPESAKFSKRCSRWRHNGFDMTKEEYEKMLEEQHHLCALCFEPFDESYAPAVDHNHETGKARAILHTRCNSAIGLLGDDPVRVRLALEYLERHLQNP